MKLVGVEFAITAWIPLMVSRIIPLMLHPKLISSSRQYLGCIGHVIRADYLTQALFSGNCGHEMCHSHDLEVRERYHFPPALYL